MAKEVNFEIVKELGVLSEKSNGWSRQVNIIKWNNGNPKIDIRDWEEDRARAGKGITLNLEEVDKLTELLDIDLESIGVY